MTKTARNTKTAAAVAVVAQTALFAAMGKAQGEGRAAAFRADPSEENMQAILDAAEANLRKLMKSAGKTKAAKPSLKIVAKNEKASTAKAMVKVEDATDAQIKRAYKAEFEKTLSTVNAMRKGLIKAGVKAIPAKSERVAKPAKVSKKVSAKKATKKVVKADNTKAIKSLKAKIAKLQDRRADTDDRAKRAKLMTTIRSLRGEVAELKAA